MIVTSSAITDNMIKDKYGKRGTQFNEAGIPNYSIPLEIKEAPVGTVSFAIFMEDIDAIPVCGYSWIHWVAANIEPTNGTTSLAENVSINAPFIQGLNSWSGKIMGVDKSLAKGYGGMAPPDKSHKYDTYVYALDSILDLKEGFYANELIHAMEGHILDKVKLSGIYNS